MKHNLLKSVIISVILLMGVSNAWAYVTYYLKSSNTTWSTDTYDWGFTHGTTTTTYMDNNGEFKLWRTDRGQDGWFGQGNNTTINLKENDHNGVQLQQWKDGGNVKYVGPSGMVCFHMDQNDGKEDKPWVWITRPTFYLKHNWGGGSWTWKGLKDNEDGTYTLTAKYGGTGVNYGDDNTSQDGWGYIEDKTPDGNPTTSHNCEFKFNSKDKSLTITRLYTITYNGNGHTGGTVPEAVDKKHGTSITLSSSIPTRTGYTFAGWNTKQDGTGNTYAKGATYSTNADVTLYAKWTPVPTLEISTSQQYLRTGKDKLQLTINHENIPENSKYRVHCTTTDGYYPNSSGLDNIDISGSGTINYTSQSSLGLGNLKFVVEIYNSNNLIITSNEIQVTVQQDWEVAVYKKIDNIETLIRNISPTENIGVEVTAEVVTGYAFTGWTANTINITFEDASALSTLVYAKSGGVIYANYTKMYAVQVSVATGQEAWGQVSTSSINVGSVSAQQITATANTNLGYVFDHWEISDGITITTGDANSATIEITATKDGSLTAHFRGENRPQNIYLIGDMNNGQPADANWQFYKLPGESGNTVTLTKTINKSDYHEEGYKFGVNIYQAGWDDKWWHNSAENDTKMDAHNCTGWVFGTKDGNKKTFIDLNVSGEYTFTLAHSGTYDKQALSITYPDKSFIEGDFATAWDENAYPLTENGDIQTVTIPITSKKDVEFRLVSHGKLFGSDTKILVGSNSQELSPKNMEDQGAVMTIGAYVEGDYVFSYNKSTKLLTVEYPSVNQLQVYTANPAHDAAKKNWDWDSQNGNVYTKTLSLNANTTYTFKAVVNSDFYGQTATLTRKNPSSTLSTEGGNVTITTDIAGNYTFTFNSSTKNLTVTYPIAHTIIYGVGDEGNGIVSESSDIRSGTLLAENTSISLKATPNLGYKFVGWYREAACTTQVSTANPYTFDLTTDTTLYAKFVLRNLYIHADFVNWEGRLVEPEFKDNSVVYTYTGILEEDASSYNDSHKIWDGGHHFHYLYSLEGIEKPETQKIAYNYNNVDGEHITYTKDIIDGVHKTANNNPTIQFGLTRKSDVTITLTLQSAIEDRNKPNTLPTVHIEAIPYYNITWKDENDQVIETTEPNGLKQGSPLTLPEVEPRMGYKFVGWNTAKDGTGSAPTQTVEGDATYYQVWEERLLYIKANWLNDIGGYTQMTRNSDSEYTYQLNSMHPTTYAFQICDKNGEEYQLAYCYTNVQEPTTSSTFITNIGNKMDDDAEIQFNLERWSDLTITLTLKSANDDPKPTVELSSVPYYTLTYDLNYDAQNRIYYFNHLLSGANIEIAEGTPTRPGYTWTGWNSEIDGTGEAPDDSKQMGEQDRTYYAQWTPATYTIALDHEGGSGTQSVQATYGSAMPTITIPTRTDHLFMGYYDGDDGTGTQYYNADGTSAKNWDKTDNTTLHAKWLSSSDCIFFYNNLGWNEVYVYFYSTDKYWDGAKGTGSQKERIFEIKDLEGNVTDADHKPHYLEYRGKMTKIEGTNIWYYNRSVHSEIRRDNYTTVAFTKDEQYGYEFFYDTEVVRRGDFNSNVPMFVSMKVNKVTKNNNKTSYYNTGYWMNYPTNTGYKLHIFDENGNTINAQLVDIPFEYGDNMIMPWSVNVSLEGAKTYAFKIQRADGTNEGHGTWYGNNGKMTTDSSGDVGQTAWEFTTGTDKCKITTTAPGTYVFTLKYGKDAHNNYNYLVGVEYPASVGDYRLAYKDNAHPFHPGHLLKQREGEDTVSFFVHYNNDPVIMLQQVTAIDPTTEAITWETRKTYALTANQPGNDHPGQAKMPGRRNAGADEVILHIGGEHLENVDATGVYNFILEQTSGEATLQKSATKYDGNFYIRTNSAIGGWGNFRQNGNKMTYSSYAEINSDFNHYFVEWIEAETGGNVKFTIANDYSYCISDTLDADNIIQKYGVSPGCLPADANVRFGWDSRNNKLTRAYIAGSGNVWDRFLVVTGNDLLKDASGNVIIAGPSEVNDETKKDPRCNLKADEVIFTDLGNWVYQVDVTAQNGTMINLTALYNGTIQYFKGAEGEPSYPLLASTNGGKEYKIRMIYNFKTNHLVVAWMPDSPYEVQRVEPLGTDMLLIRRNQEQATQIQLNSGAEKKINNIKTAYAVMTFTKDFVEEDEYPIHQRKHYWVSFPFDVKISDVFGFSEYKDHWIMQAYDGAGRAANGLWADTDTYWKYITNANYVMRKGQGYVLTLDVKKMLELDPVFANTGEVSLYFPSRGELDTITSYVPTAATVPAHECTIERENRKIYDSHWNMIGVPGFADIANFKTAAPDKYLQELEYQGDSLSFYYAYIPAENSYEVRTKDTTFQSMYSYMVQFAGTINWSSKEVTYNGQQQLAARRNSEGEYPEKVSFRLELAQVDKMADQTFVQLQEEGATSDFDMNLDLTKIINSGANIYTLVGNSRIQTAGNALPMGEAVVVPVGVKVDAEGEYTFRMPDGTEGMMVELVDYETNNRTNLLLTDYTVTLPKGTSENRFALHIQPQKDVVTSLENIGEGVNNGEAVNKYLIDGKLIIRTAEGIFDAQGHRL